MSAIRCSGFYWIEVFGNLKIYNVNMYINTRDIAISHNIPILYQKNKHFCGSADKIYKWFIVDQPIILTQLFTTQWFKSILSSSWLHPFCQNHSTSATTLIEITPLAARFLERKEWAVGQCELRWTVERRNWILKELDEVWSAAD